MLTWPEPFQRLCAPTHACQFVALPRAGVITGRQPLVGGGGDNGEFYLSYSFEDRKIHYPEETQ